MKDGSKEEIPFEPLTLSDETQLVTKIAELFAIEAEAAIEGFSPSDGIKLLEHFGFINDSIHEQSSSVHNIHAFLAALQLKEDELLSMYGKGMKKYFEQRFEEYWSLDTILTRRDINVPEKIKSPFLQGEKSLDATEKEAFYNLLNVKLKDLRRRILLEWEPKGSITQPAVSTTGKPVTGERTLILHYLMKAAGIRQNKGQRAAQIRFIAYLTGENENNIKDYYPLLSKPLNKKRVEVLKSILPMLDELQAADLMARIKDDISNAINDAEE